MWAQQDTWTKMIKPIAEAVLRIAEEGQVRPITSSELEMTELLAIRLVSEIRDLKTATLVGGHVSLTSEKLPAVNPDLKDDERGSPCCAAASEKGVDTLDANPVTVPPPPVAFPSVGAPRPCRGFFSEDRKNALLTAHFPFSVLHDPLLDLINFRCAGPVTDSANVPPTMAESTRATTRNSAQIDSSTPVKRKRGRPPVKKPLHCAECGTSSTPEWRRGKDGPNTLCNACGLQFSKRLRSEKEAIRRSAESGLIQPNCIVNLSPPTLTTTTTAPPPTSTSATLSGPNANNSPKHNNNIHSHSPSPHSDSHNSGNNSNSTINPPATSSPSDSPPSGSPALTSPLALKAVPPPSTHVEPRLLRDSLLQAVARASLVTLP
ncbi:hypothetical protein Pelo_12084 [Pelomyxa schiedti]|nr:hypothetical protein Pelo_12084 [Pelomyxa schiedti]